MTVTPPENHDTSGRRMWIPTTSFDAAAVPHLRRVACATVQSRATAIAVTVSSLLAITALVYVLGGTKQATPHLYYLPIVFAAFSLGKTGGFATALAAATAAGLMPLDTTTADPQLLGGIILRGALFVTICAAVLGALSATRRIGAETEYRDMRALLAASEPVSAFDGPSATQVRAVIHQRRLATVFQPIYSLDTGALYAIEALSRFDSEPRHSPESWFEAAHAHGLGADLEMVAIERAVETARSMQGGPEGLPPGVRLSINVGPSIVTDPRLAAFLRRHRDEVPFILEITEHTAIANYHDIQRAVESLRDMGALIAVDDAGSGISSLRHVLQLRPDIIKVDRSLAAQVAASPARQAIGRTLVDFGHHVGARVTIEGIETEDDLSSWHELGADDVQGYFTGRPTTLPVNPTSERIMQLRPRTGTRV